MWHFPTLACGVFHAPEYGSDYSVHGISGLEQGLGNLTESKGSPHWMRRRLCPIPAQNGKLVPGASASWHKLSSETGIGKRVLAVNLGYRCMSADCAFRRR